MWVLAIFGFLIWKLETSIFTNSACPRPTWLRGTDFTPGHRSCLRPKPANQEPRPSPGHGVRLEAGVRLRPSQAPYGFSWLQGFQDGHANSKPAQWVLTYGLPWGLPPRAADTMAACDHLLPLGVESEGPSMGESIVQVGSQGHPLMSWIQPCLKLASLPRLFSSVSQRISIALLIFFPRSLS